MIALTLLGLLILTQKGESQCRFELPPELKQAGSDYTAFDSEKLKWEEGVIPLVLDSSLRPEDKAGLYEAIKIIEKDTCIRFKLKQAKDKHELRVSRDPPSICTKEQGDQYMSCSLGAGPEQQFRIHCTGPEVQVMVHELMHGLGFIHTQNRHDREQYVTIYWGNITNKETHSQFEICKQCKTFNAPYECDSIMHYHDRAFSKDGKLKTIEEKKRGISCKGKTIGMNLYPGGRPTAADIRMINSAYDCASKKPAKIVNQPWTSKATG